MTAFRHTTVGGSEVLVNDGPADTAAGKITGESAAALWSRQVLTDGRLRAIVLECTAPDYFVDVHRTAERVAAGLGVSAVDVAVCGPATAVLVTDAAADTADLDAALEALPDSDGDAVLLASGAGDPTATADELAASLRTVRPAPESAQRS